MTLQNDNGEGVPLAAALDAMTASEAERAALAAWAALSRPGRAWLAALRAFEHARDNPPPFDCPPPRYPARPVAEHGGPCEPRAELERCHAAALPVREACAARLTEALRTGAWALHYQPANIGQPRQAVSVQEWRFYRVVVHAASLDASVQPVRPLPVAPPWRHRKGHIVGQSFFKPAPVAGRDPMRKTLTGEDEARLTAELVAQAVAMTESQRRACTKAGWQAKLRGISPALSQTGFDERIWPAACQQLAAVHGIKLAAVGRPGKPGNQGG